MNNINLGRYDEKCKIEDKLEDEACKLQRFPVSAIMSKRKARYWAFELNKTLNPDNKSISNMLQKTRELYSNERPKTIVSLIK